jgi:DNA-binding response OmpR family regulator
MQYKNPALHILICGNDVETCQGLSELLVQMGHIVRLCDNGLEALKLLHADEFELAILELHISGLSAKELAEKYRYVTSKDGIPLILISDHIPAEVNEMPGEYFAGYLDKPIDYGQVTALVAKITKKKFLEVGQIQSELARVLGISVFDPAEFAHYPKAALEEEFMTSLFAMFLENADKKLTEIGASVACKDFAAFNNLVHAMKGIAGNVKAKRLEAITAICQGIDRENFANVEMMENILDILQSSLQATADAMYAYLEQEFATKG